MAWTSARNYKAEKRNGKWPCARGRRKALDAKLELHKLLDRAERLKARVRAKVEHPFRVIKQQFGYAKVRCPGLDKNGAPHDAVCVGQSVDGKEAHHGTAGVAAPAGGVSEFLSSRPRSCLSKQRT